MSLPLEGQVSCPVRSGPLARRETARRPVPRIDLWITSRSFSSRGEEGETRLGTRWGSWRLRGLLSTWRLVAPAAGFHLSTRKGPFSAFCEGFCTGLSPARDYATARKRRIGTTFVCPHAGTSFRCCSARECALHRNLLEMSANFRKGMVPRPRVELGTPAFSGPCSTG
jgi:hypothetical protein